MPFDIVWDEQAKAELAALKPFPRRIVVDAVETQLPTNPARKRVTGNRFVRRLEISEPSTGSPMPGQSGFFGLSSKATATLAAAVRRWNDEE